MILEDDTNIDDISNINDDDNIITKNCKINEYNIYIDESIHNPNQYRKIFNTLREGKENDSIILIINSYGGNLDTAIQFYNYIKDCKSKTIAEIYTAYSAGSMIALSCDDIICKSFASMMIHSMSWGTVGKTVDMKSQSDFANKLNISICKNIYKGFLTDKEIDDVIKGKEFWFMQNSIERRIKSWMKFKNEF